MGENHLSKPMDSSLVWNEDKDLPDAKEMNRIVVSFPNSCLPAVEHYSLVFEEFATPFNCLSTLEFFSSQLVEGYFSKDHRFLLFHNYLSIANVISSTFLSLSPLALLSLKSICREYLRICWEDKREDPMSCWID